MTSLRTIAVTAATLALAAAPDAGELVSIHREPHVSARIEQRVRDQHERDEQHHDAGEHGDSTEDVVQLGR